MTDVNTNEYNTTIQQYMNQSIHHTGVYKILCKN